MTVVFNSLAERYPVIDSRLGIVRQRLLFVGLGAAFTWGAVAFLAMLGIGAVLDLALDLSGALRGMLDLAVIGAAAGVAVLLYLRTLRSASIPEIARTMDNAAHAHGQIVAGLDLATAARLPNLVLTEGLAGIAIREAAQLVSTVQPEELASAKPLRAPAGAIAGMGISLLFIAVLIPRLVTCQWLRFVDPFGDHPPYSSLTFEVHPGDTRVAYGSAFDVTAQTAGAETDQVDLIIIPNGKAQQVVPMFQGANGKWQATVANVDSPSRYFLRSGRARTEQYSLGVITVPRLQKVTFRIALPAYTNRPPYEGPLPQMGITGLSGTLVKVTATSNRPLSGGLMTITTSGGADQVAMIASGTNEVSGTFQIHATGKLELKVVDTDHQRFDGFVNGEHHRDS